MKLEMVIFVLRQGDIFVTTSMYHNKYLYLWLVEGAKQRSPQKVHYTNYSGIYRKIILTSKALKAGFRDFFLINFTVGFKSVSKSYNEVKVIFKANIRKSWYVSSRLCICLSVTEEDCQPLNWYGYYPLQCRFSIVQGRVISIFVKCQQLIKRNRL